MPVNTEFNISNNDNHMNGAHVICKSKNKIKLEQNKTVDDDITSNRLISVGWRLLISSQHVIRNFNLEID